MSIAEISLGIAIVGTGTSLFFALRADRRQKRSEQRAERGRPIVVPDMPPAAGDGYVNHVYRARNAGQAVITYLLLWIEDSTGETISTGGGGEGTLEPGGSLVLVGVVKVLHPERVGQRLMIRWRDRFGEVTEWTGITPQTPSG